MGVFWNIYMCIVECQWLIHLLRSIDAAHFNMEPAAAKRIHPSYKIKAHLDAYRWMRYQLRISMKHMGEGDELVEARGSFGNAMVRVTTM